MAFLGFSDNSTDAAFGTDSSDNSNTWTVNNLSVGTSARVTDYLTHTGGAVGSGAFNSAIGSVSSLGSYSGDTWTATNTGWVDTWDFSSDTGVTSFTLSNWSVGSYSNQKWYLSNDSSFASAVDGPNSGNPANGTHSLEVSGVRYRYCRIQNVPGATYSIVGNGGTPGPGADSLIDTPTNYTAASGNNGGNYPTWNPLINSNQTFSNGNLELTTATNYIIDSATMYTPPGTGQWYWEFVQTAAVGLTHWLVCFPVTAVMCKAFQIFPKMLAALVFISDKWGSIRCFWSGNSRHYIGYFRRWRYSWLGIDAENGTVSITKAMSHKVLSLQT